jgi:formamidopyrimidine-DNA glycosylase
MPELPEVETIVRTLRPALIGKNILSADLRWTRTLAAPSISLFKKYLKGQRIESIERRAKFLDLQLSDFHLIIHLRMSGDLLVVLGGYQPANHDRLILQLSDDTSLIFNDTRKFGRVWLVKDPAKVLGDLGPEPLTETFDSVWLFSALQSHRRQLKPLLLDQTFVAGLGNIYTDEALHRARLHPKLRSDSITKKQAGSLQQAIQEVLEEGIRQNGASIDWVYRGGDFQNHFRVYGRKGEPCPVCSTTIERITVGQRGTHYCPHCQVYTKPKNLVKY